MSGSLLTPLESLREALGQVRIPLPVPGAEQARALAGSFTNQLDDYILPRLRDADAPLLAVVGGSTGSGKSTLVNRLVGTPVTTPGVLRPTTRHPVLAHNPADADWFAAAHGAEAHILPRLPRITGGTALGGTDDVFGLRLVAVDTLPAGLGLLDAPDLDSVSQTNREMAGMLMAAADLWFFVTTASRYADAVPWAALRAAVDRNAAVVIVLNRVPPEAMAEVTAHVRQLLAEERLGTAPLFVIPESPLVDGMLPPDRTSEMQTWVNNLVADAATRAAVARRTVDGAVGHIVSDIPGIADAVGQQLNSATRLRAVVDESYGQAVGSLEQAASDGSLMRGEVLARWQEFVGTGQVLKRLEEGVGRLRDRISAAVRGEPAPPEKVSEAIESGLATLLVDAANDSARRVDTAWRHDDAGRALLAGADLARASADFPDRAAAAVRAWQGDLLEMVRSEGADKRQTARALAYSLNLVSLTLMVAVFSTTGGLSGAEIGIAGGTTVLAQKLLEAVFGEDGVRRMSKAAMEKLTERVTGLMDEEKSRFTSRLDALDLDPELPARLHSAAAQVQQARHAEDADAVLPAGPPAPGGGRASEEVAHGVARLVEPLMMKDLLARLNPLRSEPVSTVDGAALDRRLAGLAEAADVGEGRLPPHAVEQARSVAQRAQARRGLSEQLTVVAFAGSTGAGKSTLFNSIVGEEVAKAGVLRPTTSEPLAAIWRETPEIIALLQWLGVPRWHVAEGGADALADLVLIDLPDHDSTESAHRAYVDHFVERVDLMVWVLDPQKYADALVHDQYLRRFSRHDDVTVVVLNQVDRLPVADANACLSHLRRLVADDGLSDAVVLATSNLSGEGLESLADRILAAVGGRRTALARLAADVATAADGLARVAADPGTPVAGVDAKDLSRLTDVLTDAAGAPVIAAAIEKSSQLKASQAVGWPPLKWLSRLRKDPVAQLRLERPGVDPRLVRSSLPSNDAVARARANTAVMEYVDHASAGAPEAWVQSSRAVADAASAALTDHLDQAVTRAPLVPPRDPRWWSVFGVLQWALFAVALAGGLWLLALAGLAYLQFHVGQAPTVEGVPIPTLMLIVGAVGGVVLAGFGRLLARTSARRAGSAARAALRSEVAAVAKEQIAGPVAAELATLERFRAALTTAQGG